MLSLLLLFVVIIVINLIFSFSCSLIHEIVIECLLKRQCAQDWESSG